MRSVSSVRRFVWLLARLAPGTFAALAVATVAGVAANASAMLAIGFVAQTATAGADGIVGAALLVPAAFAASLLLGSSVEVLSRRLQDKLHLWMGTTALHARLAGADGGMEELDASRESYASMGVQSWSELVTSFLSGLVAVALVATWNPLVAIGLVLVWLVFGQAMSTWLNSTYGVHGDAVAHDGRAGYVRELLVALPAAREIRLFGSSAWLLRLLRNHLAEQSASTTAHRAPLYRKLIWTTVLLTAANAGAIVWIAIEAYKNGVSIGTFTVVVQALFAMAGLALVGDAASSVARAAGAVRDLYELPTIAPTAPIRSAPESDNDVAIRLHQCTYRYPNRVAPAIDAMSLTISDGECVAVVGANGAGKSTLFKLLYGTLTPDDGRIYVDDARLSVMLQSPPRYPLDAADNIAIGRDLTSPQLRATRVRDAAVRAGVPHELLGGVLLARGYDASTEPSGGQWQRIALARALYQSAHATGRRVLLLDEPASALDVHAEKAIFDTILAMNDATRVFITHRLSGVTQAPRILVLDHGKLVGDGTHDSLLASCGTYAHMWRAQTRRLGSE